VASDTGGIPEWLHHNKWGFLVPPRDPTALSDGVLTLLRDRDLRLRFGKQGRAFVLENYHPDAYRDRLLRIVERYAA
jgi:glycosyltransferase involved in cell wall biosynthesis